MKYQFNLAVLTQRSKSELQSLRGECQRQFVAHATHNIPAQIRLIEQALRLK